MAEDKTKSILWNEIAAQPELLSNLAATNRDAATEIARWLSGWEFSYALVAARGTSDNAARYAQYLWGARNRLTVALAAPSLFGSLASPPDLANALVVGMSQSGESPDLIAVLAEAARQGRPTLAITNHRDSPMAEAADRVLELGVGEERAIAATKTYTSQLMAVALLSSALAGDPAMLEPIAAVGEAVAAVLEGSGQARAAAQALSEIDRCAVLGRGFHQATAFEWALKLTELTYVVAQPYSTADFLHGPVAMIEPGFPVLAVATTGAVYDQTASLLADLRTKEAMVVAVTDRDDCPADHRLLLPAGVPEWLSPIPAIVAGQVLAYHLTVAKGFDPDVPRGLSKVTRTR
jgi:glucosamine--fructose-6-phosphate aminotransferase (isomerizing)